jgi:hypothetical protein
MIVSTADVQALMRNLHVSRSYIYHQVLKHIPTMPALNPDPLLEGTEQGAIRIGEGESLLFSPLGSDRGGSSSEEEDEVEGEVLEGVGKDARRVQ